MITANKIKAAELLFEQKKDALTLMQVILPNTLASTAELSASSICEALQTDYSDACSLLKCFFKIVKHNAAGIRRARTTAGPIFSVSDFCLLKAANSLPESARDLWEKQWLLSVDDREKQAVTMQQLRESFNEYCKSSTLHMRWGSLLIQEALTDSCGELTETEEERCFHAAEFNRSAVSFRAFYRQNRQEEQQKEQREELSQLLHAFQNNGSLKQYNALAEHAAVARVKAEYYSYMLDAESYCGTQEMLDSDSIEMLLGSALVEAADAWADGAGFPALYGQHIMAEFEYYIATNERENSEIFPQV